MTITTTMTPRRRRTVAAAFAACCLACGLAAAVPADAATTGPAPFLYCVATPDSNFSGVGAAGDSVAYFGYTDTDGTTDTIFVGDDNQIVPGIQDQGQPTTFTNGTLDSAFSVAFDPVITPSIHWLLNGQTANAFTGAQQCDQGTTSPVSDVTDTTAALNGVITPNGTDTSYFFEYATTPLPASFVVNGTVPVYGPVTATADGGTGRYPEAVQTALTGLAPSTTYYYRVDTRYFLPGNLQVTVQGQQEQFSTAATPAPAPTVTQTVTQTPAPAPTVTVTATPAPAPTVTVTATPTTPPGLTLLTTALPNGTAGVAYSAPLSASGGTPPYRWLVTGGLLPIGLVLDPQTGLLHGLPLLPGPYRADITVTDSAAPARASLTERYTITIAK
jgi:hypothetical protein